VASTDAQRQAAASDAASTFVGAVGLPAHSRQLSGLMQSAPINGSIIPEYTVTAGRSYQVQRGLTSIMSYIWAHPPAGFTACCGDGSDGYIAPQRVPRSQHCCTPTHCNP